MNIRLLVVGKDKPSYISEGVQDFAKRLGPFCDFEMVFVKDERVHDDVAKVLEKEAESILKQLSSDEFVIVCDERGRSLSSIELSEQFQQLNDSGRGKVSFVIGSANGLAPRVKDRADLLLSLSPLTMNHQVVRLVLLEQLYRVFTILRGMKYHREGSIT